MRNNLRKLTAAGMMCTLLGVAAVGCASSGAPDESAAINVDSESTDNTAADNSAGEGSPTEGAEEMEISKTVKLSLRDIQTFNDTDGDGCGEFQGWGTSLCWWANRVGYSEELTAKAAEAFFDAEKGLGMNIGRYNVGGGDNVIGEDIGTLLYGGNDFLHEAHIKRSDSVVPGYCTDVTRIDLTSNSKEYYTENYDRADFDCGYAWNYDWDADTNQMNVLKAAAKASGDAFIAEAFSNSPPYFMTVSGCSSGAEDAAEDNLREDSYTAFACYLADVIEHWQSEGVIAFQSVSPMNEPATSYWGAFSEKQEGCHFMQGDSQSHILTALNEELHNKGIDIIICGTDETSIDTAVMSFNALSDEAKDALGRIDTHSYQGTQRSLLKETAEAAGKNLWMSEVDGTYSIGKKDTGMQAALGFSEQIIKDMNGLMPSAWIMWDAVDIHIDVGNEFDTCTREQADEIISSGEPFWGIAIADHDTGELLLSKKYYAFGQFTRFIRPGYSIIGVDDKANSTLTAYGAEDGNIVIIAMNTSTDDARWEFDLSDFGIADSVVIKAVRTSGSMEDGENWSDVSDNVSASFNDDRTAFSAVLKQSSITTFVLENAVYID